MHWGLIALICTLLLVLVHSQTSSHRSFLEWKLQHGKDYVDQTQELYRFYVYTKNVQTVKTHNSDETRTYQAAVNKFADLTQEEFERTYLTLLPPSVDQLIPPQNDTVSTNLRQEEEIHPNVGACSTSIYTYDWSVTNSSTNPYPSAVLNQGQCGSCYAFSSVEVMNTMTSMQKKYNITYSPQQIVDCTTGYGNGGCNGGWFSNVYNYTKVAYLSTNANYPYIATQGTCKNTSTTRGPYKLASYNSTVGGCSGILAQLQKGPLAVAVSVSSSWFSYSSGVMSIGSCPNSGVNHGVMLVGVDQCGNWKIQNSWGTTWGEKGFIRLAANNTCSICSYGFYVSIL